ncbi:hypothetical protein HK405_002032, partial [Cladochytrium tenue]
FLEDEGAEVLRLPRGLHAAEHRVVRACAFGCGAFPRGVADAEIGRLSWPRPWSSNGSGGDGGAEVEEEDYREAWRPVLYFSKQPWAPF